MEPCCEIDTPRLRPSRSHNHIARTPGNATSSSNAKEPSVSDLSRLLNPPHSPSSYSSLAKPAFYTAGDESPLANFEGAVITGKCRNLIYEKGRLAGRYVGLGGQSVIAQITFGPAGGAGYLPQCGDIVDVGSISSTTNSSLCSGPLAVGSEISRTTIHKPGVDYKLTCWRRCRHKCNPETFVRPRLRRHGGFYRLRSNVAHENQGLDTSGYAEEGFFGAFKRTSCSQ